MQDAGGPVEVFRIDGFTIEVPVAALSPPLRQRLRKGQFETAERALLLRHLRADDRLLDLGAGAGLVSLTAARVIGAGAVTAVEANPQMHRPLRRNFRRNGAQGIRLIKGAVVGPAHEGKEITLNVSPGFWASSLLVNPRLSSRPVTVPAKKLPQLLRSSSATAIVMDIEGAERDVLVRPLPDQVRLVVVELHPGLYGEDGQAQIMAAMQAQGFVADHHRGHLGVAAFHRERQEGPETART